MALRRTMGCGALGRTRRKGTMTTTKSGWSRRGFVGLLSTLGVGAVGLAACGTGSTAALEPTSTAVTHAGGAVASPNGALSADEMDKMHEAGVKAFPAKTEGLGGQPLAPRI